MNNFKDDFLITNHTSMEILFIQLLDYVYISISNNWHMTDFVVQGHIYLYIWLIFHIWFLFLVLNTNKLFWSGWSTMNCSVSHVLQNSFFCVQQNKEIKGLKLILSKWRYKNKTIWQTDDRLFIFVWIIPLLLIKHR